MGLINLKFKLNQSFFFILGGFDASALSFITPDQLSFIDLSYIPASTVNSLPLYYFRSLTTSQISELINSPYASLFNKDVTNTLTSLSTNQPVQTASSTSRITLNLFGLLISVFISIYFINFKFLQILLSRQLKLLFKVV